MDDRLPAFVRDGDAWLPTERAAGPWSRDMLHGGATAALLAHAVEALPALGGLHAARLSYDLWRPVPRRPLRVLTAVLRDGRKAKTVQAVLLDGDVEVTRLTALYLVETAFEPPPVARLAGPPAALPGDGAAERPRAFSTSPFSHTADILVTAGRIAEPGPASAWIRFPWPLVEGSPNSPLMATAAAADHGNGLSMAVDPRAVGFANADLTVHLVRPPAGEWVHLESDTRMGTLGCGIAASRLADAHGSFGHATQTLVIQPG